MWSLESITMNKVSGDVGIPFGLYQILKDDAVKVQHSICQQIWKTQQWPQNWKMSVFIPNPKKSKAKESSNTIVLISHSSVQFSSIAQSCPTLCHPMNPPGPHQHPEVTQPHMHRVDDVVILCRPILLLPPFPPSIRVFFNVSTLLMRWPNIGVSALASVLPISTQN